jgi:hypothetical protein
MLELLACGAGTLRMGHSASPAAEARLYAHSFQGGSLFAFDVGTEKTLWNIALADKTAMAGVGVSPDGRLLFVVDGAGPDRLRTLDAATGKTLAETAFQDRVRSMGGAAVLDVMRDGSLVLVKTYHLADAASGVLLYDWQRHLFLPVGLRSRACGSPEFASALKGTLFGACPGHVQRWQTNAAVAGDPPLTGGALTPIQDPTAMAASSGGESVFILAAVPAEGPWRLAEWRTADNQVRDHDLRGLLQPAGSSAAGGRAWLDAAPDNRTVAIAHGERVWLLERATFRAVRTIKLPAALTGLAFLPDGQEIVTLNGSRPAWFFIHAADGAIREVPFRGVPAAIKPWHFVAGPKPAR